MNTNTMIAIAVCAMCLSSLGVALAKSRANGPNVVRVECKSGIASTNVENLPDGSERVLVICKPKEQKS